TPATPGPAGRSEPPTATTVQGGFGAEDVDGGSAGTDPHRQRGQRGDGEHPGKREGEQRGSRRERRRPGWRRETPRARLRGYRRTLAPTAARADGGVDDPDRLDHRSTDRLLQGGHVATPPFCTNSC